jgi:insertion element IS1 protein InsB
MSCGPVLLARASRWGFGWRCVVGLEKRVAAAIGDRSKGTCQRLWQAIPQTYRTGICFTDFWVAYQAVLPDEQQRAVGKETGQTAPVERWKNTLRQRLARFVRLSLSFSTSLFMHEACLLLFLHRYNADCAVLLL